MDTLRRILRALPEGVLWGLVAFLLAALIFAFLQFVP